MVIFPTLLHNNSKREISQAISKTKIKKPVHNTDLFVMGQVLYVVYKVVKNFLRHDCFKLNKKVF